LIGQNLADPLDKYALALYLALLDMQSLNLRKVSEKIDSLYISFRSWRSLYMTKSIRSQKDQESLEEWLKKIIAFLKDVDIRWLTWIPIIFTCVVLIGGLSIANAIFRGETPPRAVSIIVSCSCFIIGLVPLAQILKREMLLGMRFSVKGVWPVISGVFGVILFFGSGLVLLCVGLFDL
jgi:hypothetical protein